jgi:hypothetical protein
VKSYASWLVPLCGAAAAGGILGALLSRGRKRRHLAGKAEDKAHVRSWENEGGNLPPPAAQSSSTSLTA